LPLFFFPNFFPFSGRFFFEAISRFMLQSFSKTTIFVKRKKSFFGRFFSLTKINCFFQKDFRTNQG
jgi:hypothetical protein